jgi:DNA-directed RNA polymerase specialized sigma24 family protein
MADSIKNIAADMKKSEGNVKTILYRLRVKLREQLKSEDIDV